MKNTKRTIIALAGLLLVLAVLFGIYRFTRPETVKGDKVITLEVVHGDGTTNVREIGTSREYLGEVLADEELVKGEEGSYGLFITEVEGEAADESSQEWWCLTKGGEELMTSADQTPIADGDRYELTLTVGY